MAKHVRSDVYEARIAHRDATPPCRTRTVLALTYRTLCRFSPYAASLSTSILFNEILLLLARATLFRCLRSPRENMCPGALPRKLLPKRLGTSAFAESVLEHRIGARRCHCWKAKNVPCFPPLSSLCAFRRLLTSRGRLRLRPVILITYELFLENDKGTVAKFLLTMVMGLECARRLFNVSVRSHSETLYLSAIHPVKSC